MMRLFVAIDFPDNIKDQLSALQTDIPTARWVNRDQMHLTLNFIGETGQIDTVKAALAGVQAAPFDLMLTGVGRFPRRTERQMQVLWVAVETSPALTRLHQQIAAALAGIGIPPDSRPFRPHVTLARIRTRQSLPVISDFMETHETFQTEPIPIDKFILYSSVLSSQGASYRHEAVFPL